MDAALAEVPTGAGVAEIVAEDGRSLLVARPSNLRKWFATRLGRAKVKPGVRPPTDLTPVARLLRFARTSSAFGQRLAYERLMAARFPGLRRRDLKPAIYLRLDPGERFPRVTVESGAGGRAECYGPFRSRPSAEKAAAALHKLFPLRACDYHFEPDPEWPTGVGCLYAQVRSCAAPCLSRVPEEAYRRLAADAARWLDDAASRPTDAQAWAPSCVTTSAAWALVVERTRTGLELFPVAAGRVGDGVTASTDDLADKVASLRWPAAEPGRDETWLAAWIYEKKRRGAYLLVERSGDRAALTEAIRSLAP